MPGTRRKKLRSVSSLPQPVRFLLNGGVATIAHYLALVALVEGAGLGVVWVANLLATGVGIAVSYLGNRRYVFRSDAAHVSALPRFLVIYGVVFALHGAGMAGWADWAGLNYSIGFVILTGLSAVATFLLNRSFVFQASPQSAAKRRSSTR